MPPTHPRENFGFRISDFPPTHPREFSVLSFEFWVLSYCPPSRFHYPKAVISSEAVGRAEKSAGRMGRGSLFVSQACPERAKRVEWIPPLGSLRSLGRDDMEETERARGDRKPPQEIPRAGGNS